MSTTSNGSATVESLAEVFRCFICMEKLRDARLCPHCSKLCCYSCIRRWLDDEHQQCPHCRVRLHLHDLVNCRWAEEVTIQLDNLKITETNKHKHEEKDKCELHKEKLTVYCSSCSKCICHQCALFNGLHASHVFLPLDDVYKTNMSIINDHIKQLKRRHVEFICLIEDIERNVEKVKTGRDERLREIRNSMQAMQIKIDEQFLTKLDDLNTQHLQISRETELIERTLHDIEHRISTNGKSEVITKQKDLLNTMKIMCRKPIIKFIPISYDFSSEIIPEYKSRTFIIKNFSILQQNLDPIYSESLHINGLIWRLKVYPDGNGTVRGIYLSVFLELINGLNQSLKYEYRIEMIHSLTKDSSKNIIREFTSDFEVGECWGYNKFFLLDALRTEGYLDTINDTLILRFQVRSPTYQQKSRDQEWYIKQLENDKEQLNNEIKILREKIQSTKIDNQKEIDEEYASLQSDQFDSDEDKNSSNEVLTSSCSNQTIPTEQNLRQSNEIPVISGAITTDPEVQSWKYDSNLSLVTDEDFILADILERSASEEPNTPIPNESANNNINTGEFSSYQTSLNNLILLNSQIYRSRTVSPIKSEENQ